MLLRDAGFSGRQRHLYVIRGVSRWTELPGAVRGRPLSTRLHPAVAGTSAAGCPQQRHRQPLGDPAVPGDQAGTGVAVRRG